MTQRVSWQRCDDCQHELNELDAHSACPRCGGLLAVVHAAIEPPQPDLSAALRDRLDRSSSTSGVWRFGELVLPGAAHDVVSYPEGNTPLLTRAAIDAWCGGPVQLKHEGQNPTGSFKDRGMTVAITQARRVGARMVACASTGNTSASLAAYAAQAGLTALAIVPDGQVSTGKLAQTIAYGARVLLIDGTFDDCQRLLLELQHELGAYVVNSVNPFRLEGQKTIGLDLLRQREWIAPDWIVLPAGNLGNTSALGKALREAHALGLLDRLPRIAAVQAAGAAPFAAAFVRGFDALHAVDPHTVASAIRIGDPVSYGRAVRAIRDTNGVVLSVTDAEILESKQVIDRAGVGCEPASAAAIAGIRALRTSGTIAREASAVAILTGHILKDLHVSNSPPFAPVRVAANAAAVRDALGA